MRKRIATLVAVSAVIAFVGVVLFRPASQVAIFINGTPASNLQIRLFAGRVVATTNREGTADKPTSVTPGSLVGFRPATGGFQALSFPPYGRREYRFDGPATTVIWHKFDYGIISLKTENTSVTLTEEETRQIESGERTIEDFWQNL